jgi:hypothetical protein
MKLNDFNDEVNLDIDPDCLAELKQNRDEESKVSEENDVKRKEIIGFSSLSAEPTAPYSPRNYGERKDSLNNFVDAVKNAPRTPVGGRKPDISKLFKDTSVKSIDKPIPSEETSSKHIDYNEFSQAIHNLTRENTRCKLLGNTWHMGRTGFDNLRKGSDEK